MKIRMVGAALFLGLTIATAAAQQQPGQQQQQMACEGDVYALCGQAIPDQTRIVACLRANWSKVSKSCRAVMANYGKRGHRTKDRD
jgi:hypothetical protein